MSSVDLLSPRLVLTGEMVPHRAAERNKRFRYDHDTVAELSRMGFGAPVAAGRARPDSSSSPARQGNLIRFGRVSFQLRRRSWPGLFGIRATQAESTSAHTRTAVNTGETDDASCPASGVAPSTTPERVSAAFASAPNTATPTALPIERANAFAPVTTPRSDHSTLDWAAMSDGLAIRPMPRPMTTQHPATCHASNPVRSASGGPCRSGAGPHR